MRFGPSVDTHEAAMLASTKPTKVHPSVSQPALSCPPTRALLRISRWPASFNPWPPSEPARGVSLPEGHVGRPVGLRSRSGNADLNGQTISWPAAPMLRPLLVMRDQAVSAVDVGAVNWSSEQPWTPRTSKTLSAVSGQGLEKGGRRPNRGSRTRSRQENTTALEDAHAQLNTMQVDPAQARSQ